MLSVTVKIGPRRSRGVQHGGGRLGRPINRLHRNSENSRTEIFETRTCPPVFRQIWHRRSQRFYAALMSLSDPSDTIAVLALQSTTTTPRGAAVAIRTINFRSHRHRSASSGAGELRCHAGPENVVHNTFGGPLACHTAGSLLAITALGYYQKR